MSADTELPMHAIIFSMAGGTVWASWPGTRVSVNLGQSDAVTYMMRDFLRSKKCKGLTPAFPQLSTRSL